MKKFKIYKAVVERVKKLNGWDESTDGVFTPYIGRNVISTDLAIEQIDNDKRAYGLRAGSFSWRINPEKNSYQNPKWRTWEQAFNAAAKKLSADGWHDKRSEAETEMLKLVKSMERKPAKKKAKKKPAKKSTKKKTTAKKKKPAKKKRKK